MILHRISLTSFRQYTKRDFSFTSGTTVFVGANAIGKTNLLESIHLLATGKSFHASTDSEMIAFDKEFARVKGEIHPSAQDISPDDTIDKTLLEVFLTQGEVEKIKTPYKTFSVNSVAKRMVDFAGNLKVVLFWPLDLDLITGSPSLRRKYLNSVLTQVDREYRRCLLSYERGMRQRNRILEHIREGKASRSQLLFWDQLLIKTGSYITKRRKEYLDYVNAYSIPHDAFGDMNYRVLHDASTISVERLGKYEQEEVAAGVTLVGPHRDDIIIEVGIKDGKQIYRNLSHFGSRGEQRLGVLFLKLTELAFIKETSGTTPVFLLDDILSELDHEHRQIIFDIIGSQQTIVTTIDAHFIEKKYFDAVELIQLS